jgi:N-methylhydantoinase A/oxoprolinase/acetone carboxylase beta subunit
LRQAQRRSIAFGREYGVLESDVYDRYALQPGFTALGPAAIEEYGSTTIVWPGDRFSIGNLFEIRVDCTAKESA